MECTWQHDNPKKSQFSTSGLVAIQQIRKVVLGWAPHSARAGVAMDARLRGVDFQAIREGGRWASDTSLRIYLDVVAATNGLRAMRLKGLVQALQEAGRLWPWSSGAQPSSAASR